MAYQRLYNDFGMLVSTLHLLKVCHDVGIYEKVIRTSDSIHEDDWYELSELALENVAPIFYLEYTFYDCKNDKWLKEDELSDEEEYDSPNSLYHFSSPEMEEYYRLCRLYEYREKMAPEANPFVKDAERHASTCLHYVNHVWIGFNDDRYTTGLMVETSPDCYHEPTEILEGIHDTLAFYPERLNKLRLELLKGPPVFLPALPAPKGDEHDNVQEQDI